MAILFHDGLDHYGSATGTTWATNGGFMAAGYKAPSYSIPLATTYAKITAAQSGSAISLGASLNSSPTIGYTWIKRDIPTWEGKIVAGYAFKLNAVPASLLRIFEFAPGVDVVIEPDLYVRACGLKTKYQLETGVWYFLEVQMDSAGLCKVWMANNKVAEFNFGKPVEVTFMHIMAAVPNGVAVQNNILYVDDIYVLDGSGELNTSRLGRSNTVMRLPTATQVAGFTPNTGTNHAAVDDTTPDGDSTFVSTNVENAKDLYTNLAGTLTTQKKIHALSVILTARKEEPDPVYLKAVVKSGDVEAVSEQFDFKASVYSTVQQIFETDPATLAPWEKAAALSAAWGQIFVSNPDDFFPTVTGAPESGTVLVADGDGLTIYDEE